MSGTVKEQDKDIGAAWNELPRELRAAVLRELGIFDEYSQRQEWDLKPFEELPPIVQRWLKAYETAAIELGKAILNGRDKHDNPRIIGGA